MTEIEVARALALKFNPSPRSQQHFITPVCSFHSRHVELIKVAFAVFERSVREGQFRELYAFQPHSW